jgi:hypothetical protein
MRILKKSTVWFTLILGFSFLLFIGQSKNIFKKKDVVKEEKVEMEQLDTLILK